jgi:hypothetical protein
VIHAASKLALGFARFGRIDRSNKGDVRNMLRADTPPQICDVARASVPFDDRWPQAASTCYSSDGLFRSSPDSWPSRLGRVLPLVKPG